MTDPEPSSSGLRQIRVAYYAILREQAGCSSEQCATHAATAAALYRELVARHGFQLAERQLRVAINGDFAPFESVLQDGDEVVFIPPVAGGAR